MGPCTLRDTRGGNISVAATCPRNRVTLRVGHLGLKWALTLFIFVPFNKTIAVNLLRYIPRPKLFSLLDR